MKNLHLNANIVYIHFLSKKNDPILVEECFFEKLVAEFKLSEISKSHVSWVMIYVDYGSQVVNK